MGHGVASGDIEYSEGTAFAALMCSENKICMFLAISG